MQETCTGSRWRQRNKGEQGCTHPMRPPGRGQVMIFSPPELPEAPRASSASPALSACALLEADFIMPTPPNPTDSQTASCLAFLPGRLSLALACTEISQRACPRLLGASSRFHSGLQWSPKLPFPARFPGNVEAAGLGPHCWDPLLLCGCPTSTHSLDKDKVLPPGPYKAMQCGLSPSPRSV